MERLFLCFLFAIVCLLPFGGSAAFAKLSLFDLKGLQDHVKTKPEYQYLNPINAFSTATQGILTHVSNYFGDPDPVALLIRELFESPFSTDNPHFLVTKKEIQSLTPLVIGQVLKELSLASPVKQKILVQPKDLLQLTSRIQSLLSTGNLPKVSTQKIAQLIAEAWSKEGTSASSFQLHQTEQVLLALAWLHTPEGRRDLFIQVYSSLPHVLVDPKQLRGEWIRDRYQEQDFEKLKEAISFMGVSEKGAYFFNHPEQAAFLASAESLLTVPQLPFYSVEIDHPRQEPSVGKLPPFSNSTEASILNLVAIFLKGPGGKLNLGNTSKLLTLTGASDRSPGLSFLREVDDVQQLGERRASERWTSLLTGLPNATYRQNTYQLEPRVTNLFVVLDSIFQIQKNRFLSQPTHSERMDTLCTYFSDASTSWTWRVEDLRSNRMINRETFNERENEVKIEFWKNGVPEFSWSVKSSYSEVQELQKKGAWKISAFKALLSKLKSDQLSVATTDTLFKTLVWLAEYGQREFNIRELGAHEDGFRTVTGAPLIVELSFPYLRHFDKFSTIFKVLSEKPFIHQKILESLLTQIPKDDAYMVAKIIEDLMQSKGRTPEMDRLVDRLYRAFDSTGKQSRLAEEILLAEYILGLEGFIERKLSFPGTGTNIARAAELILKKGKPATKQFLDELFHPKVPENEWLQFAVTAVEENYPLAIQEYFRRKMPFHVFSRPMDSKGNLAPHLAARHNYPAVLKCLAEPAPAGFFALKNSASETPLEIAFQQGNLEATEYLVEKLTGEELAIPNARGEILLVPVIRSGNRPLASKLINKYPEKQLRIVLGEMLEAKELEVFQQAILRISKDFWKTALGRDYIHRMIYKRPPLLSHMNEVTELVPAEQLKREDDLWRDSLRIFILHKAKALPRLINKMPAEELELPDRYGNTSLHYAVEFRNLEAVELLLKKVSPELLTEKNDKQERPIDILKPSIVGDQPLFLLLAKQMSPRQLLRENYWGQSVLMMAAESNLTLFYELIQQVDITEVQGAIFEAMGKTALNLPKDIDVILNHPERVALLIKAVPPVGLPVFLQYAASKGNSKAVDQFLKKIPPDKVLSKNKDGKTALELAQTAEIRGMIEKAATQKK